MKLNHFFMFLSMLILYCGSNSKSITKISSDSRSHKLIHDKNLEDLFEFEGIATVGAPIGATLDEVGKLWVVFKDQVTIFSSPTEIETNFKVNSTFLSKEIVAFTSSSGELWFLTDCKLVHYKNGEWDKIEVATSIHGEGVTDIIALGNNNIIIVGQKLFLLFNGNSWRRFNINATITTHTKDHSGNLWFATSTGRIFKLVEDGVTEYKIEGEPYIRSIAFTRDGAIWALSQGEQGSKLALITEQGLVEYSVELEEAPIGIVPFATSVLLVFEHQLGVISKKGIHGKSIPLIPFSYKWREVLQSDYKIKFLNEQSGSQVELFRRVPPLQPLKFERSTLDISSIQRYQEEGTQRPIPSYYYTPILTQIPGKIEWFKSATDKLILGLKYQGVEVVDLKKFTPTLYIKREFGNVEEHLFTTATDTHCNSYLTTGDGRVVTYTEKGEIKILNYNPPPPIWALKEEGGGFYILGISPEVGYFLFSKYDYAQREFIKISEKIGLIPFKIERLNFFEIDNSGYIWIGVKFIKDKEIDNNELEEPIDILAKNEWAILVMDKELNILKIHGVNPYKGVKIFSLPESISFGKDYIWLGSIQGVVLLSKEGGVMYYTEANGLKGEVVVDLKSKGETVWVLTESGLNYKKEGEDHFHFIKDAPVQEIKAVSFDIDNEGRIWLGGKRGLYMYNGEEWIHIKSPYLEGEEVEHTEVDNCNRVWVVVANRIVIITYKK